MNTQTEYIGKNVEVRCPAYKNGTKSLGVITGIKSELTYFVRLNGNSKSSTFAACWITLIQKP